MASKCYQCFRPISNCFCKGLQPINSNTKFVFLIHPKEAFKQKTGTGRLAHLSLKNSELIIGVDFTDHPEVNALINDPDYYPVLLYPGDDSLTSQSAELHNKLNGKKLLVFIIDATWSSSKKMLRLSKNINALPHLSFIKDYRSQFKFKTQPRDNFLSTIESAYYLIEEMKEEKMIKQDINPQGLMEVFQKMIDFQMNCEQDPTKISYRKSQKLKFSSKESKNEEIFN